MNIQSPIVLPSVIPAGGDFTAGQYNTLRAEVDALLASALKESSEQSLVNVAGNTNSALGSGNRVYSHYTLPTTEKLYIFTGIEVKNGGSVAGTIYCGVDLVNDIPPSASGVALIATGRPVAMVGASQVQRISDIVSSPIRGGSKVGAWFSVTNNAATFGKTTVASSNLVKPIAAAAPAMSDFTAWSTSTDEFYIKLYFRGYE